MLSSRVKIWSFRGKAHLVFHWCLYNKTVFMMTLMPTRCISLESVYEAKSLFQYFESSSFQRHYFKVWTVFEKKWRFYNTWKLCDFALKNGHRIARPKCPDDVVLWTRLPDCNTIRRLLAIHNINILVVILKIQRKHSIRNRSTCCFASETFLGG